MKSNPISYPAHLEPVASGRRAYGVHYTRTANGQIWRTENLVQARQRWAAVQ